MLLPRLWKLGVMTRTFWVRRGYGVDGELGEVVYEGGRITSLQIRKSDRGSTRSSV
jgi:hypothetical protein